LKIEAKGAGGKNGRGFSFVRMKKEEGKKKIESEEK